MNALQTPGRPSDPPHFQGPENALRVQAKLQELRAVLAVSASLIPGGGNAPPIRE